MSIKSWYPVRHEMEDPMTGERKVRIVITCNSDKEFEEFMADMEERLKPKILKSLQVRARAVLIDIFGGEVLK